MIDTWITYLGGLVLVTSCEFNAGSQGSVGMASSEAATIEPTSGGEASTSSPASSGPTTGTPDSSGTDSDPSTGESGDQPLPRPDPFDVLSRLDISDPDATDDDPTLRADQLEMLFASDRVGTEDIFVTTRAETTGDFGVPQRVEGTISTNFIETTPELSPDGLLLLFSTDRRGNGLEIYYSERVAMGTAWALPLPLSDLSSPGSDFGATLQADESTLLMCSDRPPLLGLIDPWRGQLNPKDLSVVGLGHLDSLASDQLDCPGNSSADMTWLYFTSARPERGAVGAEDLWVAERDARTGEYLSPYNLDEINSPDDDSDPWISPDMQTIYFASDRTGSYDLYMAQQLD